MVAVQEVIARNAAAVIAMPAAGDDAVADALGEPAAGDRADRHADQEAEQHQRGAELRIRVHGRPGEHGDVEQRRHQRRPDREVGEQRSVGTRERSSAAAISGCAARRSRTTKHAAETAPSGSSQSAAGEIAPVVGSSAEKLTMTVESAIAEEDRARPVDRRRQRGEAPDGDQPAGWRRGPRSSQTMSATAAAAGDQRERRQPHHAAERAVGHADRVAVAERPGRAIARHPADQRDRQPSAERALAVEPRPMRDRCRSAQRAPGCRPATTQCRAPSDAPRSAG